MTQRKHTPIYTAEFRERGIRLFKENRANYSSDNAAYRAITSKPGCSPDSLRAWCQKSERDTGKRDGLSSEDKARLKALERENRELRQANEILKKASAYFAPPLGDASIACRARGRSSTARFANGEVHPRAPHSFWCRANLQSFADCTIHWPAGECPAFTERQPITRRWRYCATLNWLRIVQKVM